MSVLLNLTFACLAIAALAAMLISGRRYAPLVAELRRALRAPAATDDFCLTVAEHVLLPIRPSHGLLRRRQRPKPTTHRLLARARHVAA